MARIQSMAAVWWCGRTTISYYNSTEINKTNNAPQHIYCLELFVNKLTYSAMERGGGGR